MLMSMDFGSGEKDVTDRILIYHAGTGRTTMIAMIKLTTLFISAFFCGIIVPSYVNSGKDILDTAQGSSSHAQPLSPIIYTQVGRKAWEGE